MVLVCTGQHAIAAGGPPEMVLVCTGQQAIAAAGARLDGASVYQALEQQKCDGTAGVPTIFLNLLDHMAAEKKKLSHLKLIQIGGAACPAKLVERLSK